MAIMSKPILYLFPDTNLFVQCLPLDQLDWSELGDFEEIRLIVSRPVQREIDDQKNRGNDRVAKRARRTYPMFRRVITGELGYEVVNSEPPVKLVIQSNSLPSDELADVLDYNKPDDEIVGSCYRFMLEKPDLDVRLLTHDTGPMMAAKSVNVPFIPINDDWLLSPENSESERKITRLEDELARMKRTEPRFNIRCINEQGAEIDSIEIGNEVYEPLSDAEISDLLDILKHRFPMATNFDSSTPRPQSIAAGLVSALWGEWEYVPATAEEIEKYRSQEYPDWLDACKVIFSRIHEELQRSVEQPSFSFSAVNEGTRPGNDSLVEIMATGNFKIFPAEFSDDTTETNDDEVLSLSAPPKVPEGKWTASAAHSVGEAMGLMRSVGGSRMSELLYGNQNLESLLVPPVYQGHLTNPKRDRTAFYYKSDSPEAPANSYILECEQWHHATEPEDFDGVITFEEGTNEVRGVIDFVIRASNLSEPVYKRIPVRIEVRHLSPRTQADSLIEQLDPMSVLKNRENNSDESV